MKSRWHELFLLTSQLLIFGLILFFTGCPVKKKTAPEPVISRTFTTIKRGETIEIALNRLVDRVFANTVINTLKGADFSFRRCLPGDTITLVKKDSQFVELIYKQSPLVIYYIKQSSPYLTVSMKCPFIKSVECFLEGCISSSLYETMIEQGETPELIYRFADIFSWEIDFTTETQKGDSFYIVFEKSFCDSVLVGYSRISIVRYKGFVGDYYGMYYLDPNGYDDYYNKKGESLRKSLLKSPLKYSHISSYFSKKRYHPILKIWRPHHGLDYSTPTGTPVSSIGDGSVVYKGWKGGYGNLLEIRHKNGFKTRYGHLSRYAAGMSNGKRVKMGEIIGYVGSTGLSTGPHLHFEMHKDGVPINPMKVKLPRAPSVKSAYLNAFLHQSDSLVALMASFQVPAVSQSETKGGK